MAIRFTKEQKQWLIDNFDPDANNADLCDPFNKKFGTDYTVTQIRNQISYLGLKSNFFWTDEQNEWLKENYPKLGSEKTCQLFNEKFKTKKSQQAIKSHCHILGDVFLNRDVKRIFCRTHYDPVGTIKEDPDGYFRIKTKDVRVGGWEMLHRYIWECYHDPIPKGYRIFFIDGNRKNCRIDNLILISNRVGAMMNINRWNGDNRDIAMCGLTWCQLQEAIKERKESCVK